MKRLIPLVAIGAVALAACSSSKTNTASPPSSASPSTTTGTGVTSSMNIGNPPSAVTLSEAGSSLLYPFLQVLEAPLHTQYSNITLSPAAGGSGLGISEAIDGTADMGGSDAYLSNGQMSTNPTLMNIPIAVSSQAVNYNLPGIKNLRLSGSVLAQIYSGQITKWNDTAIAALNPGVGLPATGIVPVHRVDSSGDTFIFTSFLSATNTTWANGPGFSTSVNWPSVPTAVTANGNPGMVQTCQTTPGCIAYIGISAESLATAANLGEAELENQAGSFVQPNPTTVDAAVTAGSGNIPNDLAASLIYQPGAQSYPIVNFEYIVVKSSQSSSNLAQAIRTFLAYAISPTGGSSPTDLAKKDFEALPAVVVPRVESAIAKITG